MTDPMAEIRASFFVECEELLESLFDALEAMSDGQADGETLNIAFRAVHSIKGGAGAFALNDLVDFAHHFETVMDGLRCHKITSDETLIALFFKCGDILSDLVRAARDGTDVDQNAIDPVTSSLIAINVEGGANSTTSSVGISHEPDFQPIVLDVEALDFPPVLDNDHAVSDAESPKSLSTSGSTKGLSVYFEPEPELYESGNEPLFLLRSLADLGPIKVTAEPSILESEAHPTIQLAWRVYIETEVGRTTVEEIFEFVVGLCTLEISEEARSTDRSEISHSNETTSGPSAKSDTAKKDIKSIAGPPSTEPPTNGSRSEVERIRSTSQGANATVRVEIGRIDRLVNLVGELVINQSMLSQSLVEADLAPNSAVSNGLDEFLQLTRDIQESVMMIRAQPVKSLFQRMSRIVREASAAIDKKVLLVTEGENTEIDKTVIERLADPLTHMIRNAVDHGLEGTAGRLAAGKSETGQLRLVAMHKSGRVVIEVADDGAGIDRNKVREIAEQKELISPDAQLTDADIDQLLFMPGFSTAEKVSSLSGRGVGMDVVKNAIAALGGRISIQSTQGQGTVFSISLPLTLAVQDGMVVKVAGETLVVPLNAIIETLTLENHKIQRLGSHSSVITVRDTVVPLLDLGVELGYRPPLCDYTSAIALLVGQDGDNPAALMVDAIIDQRQVVIKGLQESYGHVSGVAAATILGNGQIALILDTSDLVFHALGHSRSPLLEEAS